MAALREVAESLPGYGELHRQFQFEGRIELQGGGGVTRHDQSEPIGFRVIAEDRTRVVQLRTNGFTFSRLQPYTSWSEIREEAQGLVERYVQALGSRDANRLALRYINHLRVPYPTRDLDAFILGLPSPPEAWPDTVVNFLSRLTFAEPSGASVHVTQALVDDVDEDRIGVIFDIEAFHEDHFAVGDERFWSTFEELRDLKNRIFFGGITERTMEMYV